MKRKLEVGDRVVLSEKHLKHTGCHGVVIDRTERGHGIGFSTLRVRFDNGELKREPVSYFVLERGAESD